MPKIRKIASTANNPYSLVNQLKNTKLGLFYITYLKKYTVIRQIVRWIWKHSFLFFLRLSLLRKNAFPITSLNDFVQKKGLPVYKLADPELVKTPLPTVFPVEDQHCLQGARESYSFPELFVSVITNAVAYGNSNLIYADNEVICHDLYDFSRDYTSEELHVRILIHVDSKRTRGFFDSPVIETVPIAAPFVDACASNYAHWLTEVLPRIAVFCEKEEFKGIPLIVNADLHPNIIESLTLVAGNDREIITLSVNSVLAVDKLYLTSVTGYVPFDQRNIKISGHSHGMFSPFAFEVLRKKLTREIKNRTPNIQAEKIYIRRTSGTRKIINTDELEELLVSYGYTIIEPENLSFSEQVQLFKQAKAVIAATGAALANAIFCSAGTKVGVLMAKHESMIYNYWNAMLAPQQLQVSYVLGNITQNRDLGIHGDFFINPADFKDLLESFANK